MLANGRHVIVVSKQPIREFENKNSHIDHSILPPTCSDATSTNHNSAQMEQPESSRISKWNAFLVHMDFAELHEMYETTTILAKAVWMAIMLLSLSGLSVQLYDTFNQFINRPIFTTTDLVVDPDGMIFPDVYLCPPYPIHFETYRDLNVKEGWEEQNIDGLLAVPSGLSDMLAAKQRLTEQIARWSTVPDTKSNDPYTPSNITDFFIKAGYPTTTFLKECAFNNEPIDCEKVATPMFDQDYGKCFLISSKWRQTMAGVGLSLVLDLDMDNAYPTDSTTAKFVPQPIFDAVIMKVAQTFSPISADKILLNVGTYTIAKLEVTQTELMQRKRPHSDTMVCTEAEEGKNYAKILNTTYSVESCQTDCAQQLAQKYCACLLPIDPRYIKSAFTSYDQTCKGPRMKECVYPMLSTRKADIQECAKACQAPCDSWQYRIQMSEGRFPSKNFREAVSAKATGTGTLTIIEPSPSSGNLQDTFPVNDRFPIHTSNEMIDIGKDKKIGKTSINNRVKRNIVLCIFPDVPCPNDVNPADENKWRKEDMIMMDMAFSSIEYVHIAQSASMTLTTLLANVGGTVGLWVGWSMITVIKFGVLISPLMCPRCCGKRRSLQPVRAHSNPNHRF